MASAVQYAEQIVGIPDETGKNSFNRQIRQWQLVGHIKHSSELWLIPCLDFQQKFFLIQNITIFL